ncbi:SGNH/GDSL hydrolase family protein [Candidatus Uhrbacteria bacterium]|nr:SGNH/GDSL hydrolase family protein [Candidatus Uhrbacteria bacterium]
MNICIFGDSIAWGANDFEYGGWPAHLRNYLYQKNGTKVYALGISGDVTTEAVKRIASESEAREADIIIIALGINDSAWLKSKEERWTPLEEFKQNIALLYEKARMFTDKIFFIGLTPIDETKLQPAPWAPDYFVDAKTKNEYNEAIRAFCKGGKRPLYFNGRCIDDG